MPLILLLLFIGVPLGELALLLWIAEHTHWTFPLAVVIVTGALGAWLLRIQGVVTYRNIQSSLAAGRAPADPLLDAGFLLLAAGLLLTPGVVTDAFGLTLLLPPTRALYRLALKRWFKSRFRVVLWSEGEQAGGFSPGGGVVDGEVVEDGAAKDGAAKDGAAEQDDRPSGLEPP